MADTVKPTLHDRWFWPRLLARLDAAGYAVVPKPQLRDRGVPKPRPYA